MIDSSLSFCYSRKFVTFGYIYISWRHSQIPQFFSRLREYEFNIDSSTKRGPEVERIYFLIIEMARKSCGFGISVG